MQNGGKVFQHCKYCKNPMGLFRTRVSFLQQITLAQSIVQGLFMLREEQRLTADELNSSVLSGSSVGERWLLQGPRDPHQEIFRSLVFCESWHRKNIRSAVLLYKNHRSPQPIIAVSRTANANTLQSPCTNFIFLFSIDRPRRRHGRRLRRPWSGRRPRGPHRPCCPSRPRRPRGHQPPVGRQDLGRPPRPRPEGCPHRPRRSHRPRRPCRPHGPCRPRRQDRPCCSCCPSRPRCPSPHPLKLPLPLKL
ncbi:unnamed protein product [Nesidiocoris tenuis]|uniref:Uncharacterized protein n=1 Tax=Nesidiocoris tenuis TaxID=355587 RepID=A0A6H5H416_9HEMI|nr:unnamed protein product [Nesidiocoris tenuis]